MTHIAKLMNKTISEIKRDGEKVTFYDQDGNVMFFIFQNGHGDDCFFDAEGNWFDMEIE